MKKTLLLNSLLLLAAGCRPSAPAAGLAALPADCRAAGSVQFLELPRGDGLGYRYGLYLPPCYEQTRGVLPVVYLVPGRTSAPETWLPPRTSEIADDLILTGELPPFIIVAAENIDSDMYADEIIHRLIPYVESTYPISPERRHHAVAGGSLGGVAAYRIGFSMPDHFASVGMFGSGAIHGEEERIRSWMRDMTPGNRPRVFLNTGFEDSLMLERARATLPLLDEGELSHTHIFTPGDHNYIYWISNLPAYLHWAALDW